MGKNLFKINSAGMNYKHMLLLALFFYGSEVLSQPAGKPVNSKAISSSAILPAYKPSKAEIGARYKIAAILDSVARNKTYKTTVQPNWQANGESFWYRNTLRDSVVEYYYVNVPKEIKQKAFDHKKLAEAVTRVSGKKYDPLRLNIPALNFDNDGSQITFLMDSKWWKADLGNYEVISTTAPNGYRAAVEEGPGRGAGGARRSANPYVVGPVNRMARSFRSDSLSRDKLSAAYIKEGNLFVKNIGAGDEKQLTTDGTKEKPYGYINWSPDNKTIVAYHTNPVKDKQVYYVLSSASGTRGELRSRGYAQPGDENSSYEMVIFKVEDGKKTKVDIDVIDFSGPPFINWRTDDNRFFTFERVDRGHQRFRIIEVNSETGKSRELVDEKTNTFIFEQRIFTHYLPETQEILWITEKDGWRHLYLVDQVTGKEKNQITKGDWVVREIDSVDKKKREIWFQASGMNAGEDPYFINYYRIGFDGKGFVRLTDANANHRLTFSADRKYYIDNYSRVDMPNTTELKRTADGKKIMELEKADISAYLATGIKLPEVFHAKGRDGVTDIWGVVFRPSKFDPKKRYPIVEQIYAGPQDSFVPKSFTSYGETRSLAELGFIVVQIDGMGTYNRSKAFHDVCWKNLADAGFTDRILWMKALAAKYPYADASNVGVYGTSAGGQNSAGAVLFHPEFYHAAVSACGCHDNRVDKQWWNEQWMGYPVKEHYHEQSNITNAHKLQGDLLLIVGEADENVPPESTYRMVDALVKAGKDFQFLSIPGMGHGDGGVYGRKKKRDFLVKSLLDVDPPKLNIKE
jgi:dipeptidyl aminopeptidase/acylaminoacyl peptidase